MANVRNAGRKPNWYKTKTMRVPEDLIPAFTARIAQYKLDGEEHAKSNTNKAAI